MAVDSLPMMATVSPSCCSKIAGSIALCMSGNDRLGAGLGVVRPGPHRVDGRGLCRGKPADGFDR